MSCSKRTWLAKSYSEDSDQGGEVIWSHIVSYVTEEIGDIYGLQKRRPSILARSVGNEGEDLSWHEFLRGTIQPTKPFNTTMDCIVNW